jgi:hypothetical protein
MFGCIGNVYHVVVDPSYNRNISAILINEKFSTVVAILFDCDVSDGRLDKM